MNFPYVPNNFALAFFIVGSFFIYIGITLSFLWLLFLGVIFYELDVFIVGLFFLTIIYDERYMSDRQQKDILL